jgi:hypothetical protein
MTPQLSEDCHKPMQTHWSIDKRVPIATLGIVVVQTVAVVWWAASLNARVAFAEKSLDLLASNAERLVRIEMRQESVINRIDRLDQARQGQKP